MWIKGSKNSFAEKEIMNGEKINKKFLWSLDVRML